MKFRPVLRQATAVVPEPMNVSSTVALGSVLSSIAFAMISHVFCVGCTFSPFVLFAPEEKAGIRQTFEPTPPFVLPLNVPKMMNSWAKE